MYFTYFMFCKGALYQCLASFLKCATDYVVGVLSTKLLISRVLLIKRCHPGVWLGLKAALCSPIDIDKPNSHLLCFIVVYFDSRCLIRFRCYRLMVFDLLLKVFVARNETFWCSITIMRCNIYIYHLVTFSIDLFLGGFIDFFRRCCWSLLILLDSLFGVNAIVESARL